MKYEHILFRCCYFVARVCMCVFSPFCLR